MILVLLVDQVDGFERKGRGFFFVLEKAGLTSGIVPWMNFEG